MANKSVNTNPKDGDSLLIDTKTAAKLCGVSKKTIQRWTKAGVMPLPHRVNGRPRWQRAVITEWVSLGCPRRKARR